MPQRASEDAVVGQHAYIRVHVHPKRFPAAYAVRWEVRQRKGAAGSRGGSQRRLAGAAGRDAAQWLRAKTTKSCWVTCITEGITFL